MKKLILSLSFALFLLIPSLAHAQVTSGKSLAWDQPNASLSEAQAYTYTMYADTSRVDVLSGVTCSGTSLVSCQVAFPAFTPGSHTLQLTAKNAAGESAKSAAFNFTFIIVPDAPSNIRVVQNADGTFSLVSGN